MCRIAILSERRPKTEIAAVFAALEASNGGHGNGIAGFTDSGLVLKKGVKFSTLDAAREAYKLIMKGGPVLFHTRLASAGGISDELCHPFIINYKWVLAHNGHAAGLIKSEPKQLNAVSDTKLLALRLNQMKKEKWFEFLDRLQPGVVVMVNPQRIWLHISRNKTFYKQGPWLLSQPLLFLKENASEFLPGNYIFNANLEVIYEDKKPSIPIAPTPWWWNGWEKIR